MMKGKRKERGKRRKRGGKGEKRDKKLIRGRIVTKSATSEGKKIYLHQNKLSIQIFGF